MVETVPCEKCLAAIFAGVRQSSWEMDILDMFFEVAPVSPCLAAEGALQTFRPQRWILDQVGRKDYAGPT